MSMCEECCGECAGASYHAKVVGAVKAFRPDSFAEMSSAQKESWFNVKYAECKRLRAQGVEPESAYYFQYSYNRSDAGVVARKKYKKSVAGKVANKEYAASEMGKIAKKKYCASEKGKAARRAAYARKKLNKLSA